VYDVCVLEIEVSSSLYVFGQHLDELVDEQGFVYVKIGRSTSPKIRLKNVQNGCPFKLQLMFQHAGAGWREHQAHWLVDKYRVNGEWFAIPPSALLELLETLTQLCKQDDQGQEVASVELFTWEEIDAELDAVEDSDIASIVTIFEKHRTKLLVVDGQKERVTVSSFARHIGMPRHTFDSWVAIAEAQSRQTA
jgi:hypothetical protein